MVKYAPVILSFFLSYYFAIVFTTRQKRETVFKISVFLSSVFLSILGGRALIWLQRIILPDISQITIDFFQLAPSGLENLNPQKNFLSEESFFVFSYFFIFSAFLIVLVFKFHDARNSIFFARLMGFLYFIALVYKQVADPNFLPFQIVSYKIESVFQIFSTLSFLILGAKLSFSMPVLSKMIVSSVVGSFLFLTAFEFFLPLAGALSFGVVSLAFLFVQVSSYFKDHNILMIVSSTLIREHDFN